MRSTIFLLGAALALAACGGTKTFEPPGPPQLSIAPASASLNVGEQRQFVGMISGDFGGRPTTRWWSSAPAVAAVDTGMVTARAPGNTYIIVQVSARVTLTDTAAVTVQ